MSYWQLIPSLIGLALCAIMPIGMAIDFCRNVAAEGFLATVWKVIQTIAVILLYNIAAFIIVFLIYLLITGGGNTEFIRGN